MDVQPLENKFISMCDLFAAIANIADSKDAAVDLGIDWGTRQFTLLNDSSVPCCAMSRTTPAK